MNGQGVSVPKSNVILNAQPASLEVLQAYQANPAVEVRYKAKAVSDGFALVATVGGHEYALERQRGGIRVFKSLNSVLSFVDAKFGVKRFAVEGDGWNSGQKEIAA